MAERGTYQTRQRALVRACLRAHAERYLTVDEVWGSVRADGGSIGRTTVYRALEAMVASHDALKAMTPGGEASYRMSSQEGVGQLVCLGCGTALPLDCHMVGEFAEHVLTHHGFKVDQARTVLYGYCARCAGAGA